MDEKKQQTQTENKQKTIECSKCNKQVAQTDGVQNSNGFVCNECNSKRKKPLIIGAVVFAIVVIAAILWVSIGNGQRTGKGFGGVGDIQDSMSLHVDSNQVNFDFAKATAVSSSVSTQTPISNLENFKHALSQNIKSANNDTSKKLVIPSVGVLFKINTNYFTNKGEALVKEFASTYVKTNKKATILLEGHTCDLGGVTLNDKLSESRAKAVKKILLAEGVPDNKIEVKCYGKSRYKEFNYSDKSEYRRVIISVK